MVRDLNESASGTLTPWRLSELSDGGEAVIEGAPGSCDDSKRYIEPWARRVVCIARPRDLEDGDEVMRSQLDARRIVASVNFAQSIDLGTLEKISECPCCEVALAIKNLVEAMLSTHEASREAAYYFPDED